jgi:PKD repeat protein
MVIGVDQLHAQAGSAGSMASPDSSPAPDAEPLMITVSGLPGYGTAPLRTGFMMTGSMSDEDTIVSYNWNLGDGTVSNLPPQVLFHTYQKPGVYVVALTVTMASGKVGTAMTSVIVRPPAS